MKDGSRGRKNHVLRPKACPSEYRLVRCRVPFAARHDCSAPVRGIAWTCSERIRAAMARAEGAGYSSPHKERFYGLLDNRRQVVDTDSGAAWVSVRRVTAVLGPAMGAAGRRIRAAAGTTHGGRLYRVF